MKVSYFTDWEHFITRILIVNSLNLEMDLPTPQIAENPVTNGNPENKSSSEDSEDSENSEFTPSERQVRILILNW